MSKQVPGNQKHMDQGDRIVIEKGLDAGLPLKQIAISLGKDPTTIAKEIKKHRTDQPHNSFMDPKNRCSLFASCEKKHVCQIYAVHCRRLCKKCSYCNAHCPDFVPRDYHCQKLDRAPFVCNGCPRKGPCRLDKSYYRATRAQKEYRTVLVESRNGINISEDDLAALDTVVSPLIRQGQSPYTILQNHPELPVSEKTLYNYIASGALSVGNLDLQKKVKYKPRSVHASEIYDRSVFEGRRYKDFQDFLREFPDTRIVEMDTVLGCEGSRKVLLTLHFENCHFMMAFLLESKEARRVEAVFDEMERSITTYSFLTAFPLILTDRGGEFAHPDVLECGIGNTIRTSIYYCDPMCSWQKPHCEKNHEYIRKVCPKGTSFDHLTQGDIRLLMSHINCAPRESLGGMTPYELAERMLPEVLLDFFGLWKVAPDAVDLTPRLLKKK